MEQRSNSTSRAKKQSKIRSQMATKFRQSSLRRKKRNTSKGNISEYKIIEMRSKGILRGSRTAVNMNTTKVSSYHSKTKPLLHENDVTFKSNMSILQSQKARDRASTTYYGNLKKNYVFKKRKKSLVKFSFSGNVFQNACLKTKQLEIMNNIQKKNIENFSKNVKNLKKSKKSKNETWNLDSKNDSSSSKFIKAKRVRRSDIGIKKSFSKRETPVFISKGENAILSEIKIMKKKLEKIEKDQEREKQRKESQKRVRSRSKKNKNFGSRNNSKTAIFSIKSKKNLNLQNQILKKNSKKIRQVPKLKNLFKSGKISLLKSQLKKNCSKKDIKIMKQIGSLIQSKGKRTKSFENVKIKNHHSTVGEQKKAKLFKNKKKSKSKKKSENPFIKKIRKNSVFFNSKRKNSKANSKSSKSTRNLGSKFNMTNQIMNISSSLLKTRSTKSQNHFFNKKKKGKEKTSKINIMNELRKFNSATNKKKKKRRVMKSCNIQVAKANRDTIQISEKLQQMKSALVIQKAWRNFNRKAKVNITEHEEQHIKRLEQDPDIISQLSRRDGVNRIPDLEVIENFQLDSQRSGLNNMSFSRKGKSGIAHSEYFVNKPLKDLEKSRSNLLGNSYRYNPMDEEEMVPICMKSSPRNSEEKRKKKKKKNFLKDDVSFDASKKPGYGSKSGRRLLSKDNARRKKEKEISYTKKIDTLREKIRKKGDKEKLKLKHKNRIRRQKGERNLKPVKAQNIKIIKEIENFAKVQISKWKDYLSKIDTVGKDVMNKSKADEIKRKGIMSIKLLKETMGTLYLTENSGHKAQKSTSYLSKGIRKMSHHLTPEKVKNSPDKKSSLTNSQKKNELKKMLKSPKKNFLGTGSDKFKHEKWIHPKKSALRVINKYISTKKSSSIMRSLSVQASTLSAVFSRSKSLISQEQDSIQIKKRSLKKSLKKGFILFEDGSKDGVKTFAGDDKKETDHYISCLIENEIKSLGNKSNLEPITGRLSRRSKNKARESASGFKSGSKKQRGSSFLRNENLDFLKQESMMSNLSLNMSKGEMDDKNEGILEIVKNAIERRKSENIYASKKKQAIEDAYELENKIKGSPRCKEPSMFKEIINEMKVEGAINKHKEPVYTEDTPEKVRKSETREDLEKVRHPISKVLVIKKSNDFGKSRIEPCQDQSPPKKEIKSPTPTDFKKRLEDSTEEVGKAFTTPETRRIKEVPHMIEKGIRRGGYINIRNALKLDEIEFLQKDHEAIQEEISKLTTPDFTPVTEKTMKLSPIHECQLEGNDLVSIQVFEDSKKQDSNKLQSNLKTQEKAMEPEVNEYIDNLSDALLDALVTECLTEYPVNTKHQLLKKQLDYRMTHSSSGINSLSDFEKIINYLKCLFTAINEQPHVQRKIHKSMNSPIGPNNLQKIKLCSPPLQPIFSKHSNQLDDSSEDAFEYSPILSIELYIQMEEIMKQSVYLDEQLSKEEIERRHILHKLIYDCLNESLDYKRVHGLEGLPFEFLTSNPKNPYISTSNCAHILENVRQEILDYSSYRAGILPEKEPGLVQMEGVDAIEVLREEIFKKILNDFANEMEYKWKNITDETHEVAFCLADDIMYGLIEEAVLDINRVQSKR